MFMWCFRCYFNRDKGLEKDFYSFDAFISYLRGLHKSGFKTSYLARAFWLLVLTDELCGTYHFESFSRGRHLRAVLVSEKVR